MAVDVKNFYLKTPLDRPENLIGKSNLHGYYSKHHAERYQHMVRPIYLNYNNSGRYIPTNTAVGMLGRVDLDPEKCTKHQPY